MTKEEWRNAMKKKLKQQTFDTFKQNCSLIYAKLYHKRAWKSAKTIGITLSIHGEVETRPIIERAWKLGKRVAVPKSNPRLRTLAFYVIQSFQQVEKGYAGIMEPDLKQTKKINHDEIDLLFVPGLVFDREGYRIGYGGGYYDRFLRTYRNKTLSLAFDFQIVDRLPRYSYDLPVQCIITEKDDIKAHAKGER